MLLSVTVEAMEAMVAERGTEMTEWNDGRLDDLSDRVNRIEKKMDAGFTRADQKMEAGFAQMHEDMRELHVRFDGLQRTLIQINGVIIAALIGLIATQI
jgi:hypothetical protein